MKPTPVFVKLNFLYCFAPGFLRLFFNFNKIKDLIFFNFLFLNLFDLIFLTCQLKFWK